MNNGHVESVLPQGRKWKLVWNDEFDGGVLFDGKSNILLPLIKDGDRYRSPHLQIGANYMDMPEEGYDN